MYDLRWSLWATLGSWPRAAKLLRSVITHYVIAGLLWASPAAAEERRAPAQGDLPPRAQVGLALVVTASFWGTVALALAGAQIARGDRMSPAVPLMGGATGTLGGLGIGFLACSAIPELPAAAKRLPSGAPLGLVLTF